MTAYCINCAQPLIEVRQVTTGVCPTHGIAHAGTFADSRPPDPWPVIDWISENYPQALQRCPYKARRFGDKPGMWEP